MRFAEADRKMQDCGMFFGTQLLVIGLNTN